MNAFDKWLASPRGKNCLEYPVTGYEYLRNRLWWAFEAGREAERQEKSSEFQNSEQSPSSAEHR